MQFEITPATRDAVRKWIKQAGLKADDFVFSSRIARATRWLWLPTDARDRSI